MFNRNYVKLYVLIQLLKKILKHKKQLKFNIHIGTLILPKLFQNAKIVLNLKYINWLEREIIKFKFDYFTLHFLIKILKLIF